MFKKFISKYNETPVSVRASVAYAFCNIVQRCMSFITLPLFTRVLTTEEYGQSSIYSSWLSILSIVVSLYLPYGSFDTAMVKYEDRRNRYIASTNSICLTLAIIFLIIYFPLQNFFNKVFELPSFLVVVMVLEIVGSNAFQCWSGKMRFEYKYMSVVAATLLLTILSPLLSYIFILNSDEPGYARIIGNAVATIGIGFFLMIQNWVKEKNVFTKEFWVYALGFNIPLIPYYLSQVIFNQSDRIMIGHIQGTDKAGIYNVAYMLAMVLTVILNAINGSYVPWLYNSIKNGNREKNKKISCYIAVIMAVLLLAVIIVAPEIILIMAGENYMEAIWVVPPVAMSLLLLFYSQLFVNVEFYFEEKKAIVSGTVLAAIVNIVLNAILIPIFGFIAAAYTTLFSYIVFAIMHYFAYCKVMKRHDLPCDLYNEKVLVIILVIFMAIGFLFMLFYENIIIRYSIILVGFIVAFIKRKEIINVLLKVKNRDV